MFLFSNPTCCIDMEIKINYYIRKHIYSSVYLESTISVYFISERFRVGGGSDQKY